MTSLNTEVQSIEYEVTQDDVERGYQYEPETEPTVGLFYSDRTAFNSQLITELMALPKGYSLVAIRTEKGKPTKAPKGMQWEQTEFSRDSIAALISSGKASGVGIKLGSPSGGIVALDVDGLTARKALGDILGDDSLPKTVACSSGKPGRAQYLFMVPPKQQTGLDSKAKKYRNPAGKDEDLNFRWTGNQSVLPPSAHPETPCYFWVEGCSPADVEIAELPEKLLNFWLGLINPVKRCGNNTRNGKNSTTPSLTSGENNKDFERMLVSEVAKVAGCIDGSRNSTLNNAAFTLAGMAPDKVELIRCGLTQAAISCGLGLAEIEATLDSAIASGQEKRITPYGSEQLIKLGQTDTGKLLATEVLVNHKYDTEAGQWYEYDGKGKWNPVKEMRVFKLAHDYLDGKVYITSDTYLQSSIRFAKTHVQVDGWSEMSSLHYLPFENGVLDLKANHFTEHSPDYGFTWQLPRAYSPTIGDWSSIDRFLDTLANNDPALKQLAIAFCNAVLKGRSDLQKFLYLFGSGANGKGAFMTLLSMLVGLENVHSTNMSELNGNRFESANLKGKRLLVMTDEDKRCAGVGTFKAATGGDLLRFEQKGKDASTFTFKGMAVVAANNPTFVGTIDGGVLRRKVDFPCLAVIPEMERVDQTPLFDSELPSFTTYLLALDDTWVTQTIRQASNIEAVKQLGRELAIREDSVAAFADTFEVASSAGTKTRGVYALYVKFCSLNGLKPKSSVNFIPSLIEHCKSGGFEVTNQRDKQGKYLQGFEIVVPELYKEG
jgi:P4 family phage/plasmid primase-like protien